MKAFDKNQNYVDVELIGEPWLTKDGKEAKYSELAWYDANTADFEADMLYDLPMFDGEAVHSGGRRGFEYHQKAVVVE